MNADSLARPTVARPAFLALARLARTLRTLIMVIIVSATTLAVSACGSRTTSDKNLSLVTPERAIELAHGKKQLIGGRDAGVYVDPRSAADYRAGHIPGAIHLPYERVTLDRSLLKGYETVIVYGADYNDPIALGMSKRLLELGQPNVYTLQGGLRAWQAAGNSVEREESDKVTR